MVKAARCERQEIITVYVKLIHNVPITLPALGSFFKWKLCSLYERPFKIWIWGKYLKHRVFWNMVNSLAQELVRPVSMNHAHGWGGDTDVLCLYLPALPVSPTQWKYVNISNEKRFYSDGHLLCNCNFHVDTMLSVSCDVDRVIDALVYLR